MFYTVKRSRSGTIKFARYAEYDMFYTFYKIKKSVIPFARYAEYDMFYTSTWNFNFFYCLLGMLNMICSIPDIFETITKYGFARYAEYDMFYT